MKNALLIPLLTLLISCTTNLDTQESNTIYFEFIDLIKSEIRPYSKNNLGVLIDSSVPITGIDYFKSYFEDSNDIFLKNYLNSKNRSDSSKINEIKNLIFHFLINYDFQAINTYNDQLHRIKFETISHSKLSTYFESGVHEGWKKLYEEYQDFYGIFQFSKIVTSENFACFYYRYSAGGDEGFTSIVLFEKKNSKWEYYAQIPVSRS